ncbi:MAG: hypothetical protein AAGI11_15290 [Pseudomonadota bacterium]
MDIEDIEQAANAALFDYAAPETAASILYPGDGRISIESRIIIDRNVELTDDFGVVFESRCEISLNVLEVGSGERGTIVDTGKDAWVLLQPIGDDGLESRWTAGRYDG